MDLESVDLVLKTARSVRRKLDFERDVPQSVIEECIDVATQAPTGMGGENWRFVVVRQASVKSALAALYSEILIDLVQQRGIELKPTHKALIERLPDIPCMIFVCVTGQPGITKAEQVAFYGSILPAAWSLMLALRARQLGTTWTTLLSARQEQVSDILGMPNDAMQTVMLPVAYMKNAVMKVADRLPARDVTFVDRWGEH